MKIVAPTTAFTSTRLLQQAPLSHSGGEAALENVTSGESSDLLSRVDERYVVPVFLRWLYRMPYDHPAPSDNTLGIAGFANEFPSQQDLFRFMILYRTDVDPIIASTRIMDVVPVNNGVDDGPIGRRGSMDTQFSVALTFPTQIDYYTISGGRQIARGGPADGDYSGQSPPVCPRSVPDDPDGSAIYRQSRMWQLIPVGPECGNYFQTPPESR